MMWIVALAICFFIIGGLFNPFLGLVGLLGANIVQPGELYPTLDVFHVERVLAILVFSSLVLHQRKLVFPRVTKLYLVFWFTMFLGVPFSFWRLGALDSALDYSRIVLYHVLIVNLVNTPRRFRIFLVTFVLLTGWLAVSSYRSFMQGNYYLESGRFARAEGVTSSGGNPNDLGLSLVASLPLAMVLALGKLWRDRLLGAGVAGISIWVIALTGSRMSFISLIFLFGAYTCSARRRLLFLPIALGVLAILWQLMPSEYHERYLSVGSLKDDASYQNRVLAWRGGWHMFLDNPLTGVGVGQFPIADGTKYWPGSNPKLWLNAHSLYVQVIAELGLFGTVAFSAFLYALFRLNHSLRKALPSSAPPYFRFYPTACSMSLLVLLFAGYSSHDLYRSTWYMLAALSGSVQILLKQERVTDQDERVVQENQPPHVTVPLERI